MVNTSALGADFIGSSPNIFPYRRVEILVLKVSIRYLQYQNFIKQLFIVIMWVRFPPLLQKLLTNIKA